MRLCSLVLSFLLTVPAAALKAGSGRSLSLDEALNLAEASNHDIRIAESEVDRTRGDYHKTLSLFLPQLSISENYVRTNDPLNVFGLKLKQEIVSQADFNPAVLNDPNAFTNFSTKIEIRQPLINADGWWGRGAASNGVEAMKRKAERTRHYVAFEVKVSYYRLVLARQSLSVIEKALEAAHATRDQARRYFAQGLIHKSDLLFAEVRSLEVENKKLETENEIRNASDRLRFLLGLEEDDELIPTDTLSAEPEQFPTVSVEAVNLHRSDMQALRGQVDAEKNRLRMNQFRLLPSLNAFAAYEWNDGNPFGQGGKNWMIGAALEWDLFPGFDQIGEMEKARAGVKQAQAGLEKAALKNETEIRSAYRSLETNARMAELSAQAVVQAEENYRVLSDRYAKGLESMTDLLASEAAMARARLDHLQALFAYRANLFTLELLTEKSYQP